MQKIDIEIKIDSYNFWWAEYGFAPNSWEDIYIEYTINGKKEHHSTELRTPYSVRHDIELEKDALEEAVTPYVDDVASEDWHKIVYGKTAEELMETKELVFGYFYSDSREDSDFYEITDYPVELPTWNGMKPRYIGAITPHKSITKKVVEEFVTLYTKTFLNLEVESIKFIDEIPYEEAKKYWEEEVEERKKNEEFIKNGGKYEIIFDPMFMDCLYGKEIMAKYGDTIKLARPVEGTSEILLEFKDGHTEIFDPNKKDWE